MRPIFPTNVLAIEGEEPQRILRDAAEDLHDTVFLELPDGVTLDLESARFIDATDEQDARTEFHFPREIDGRTSIDAEIERVIFHCKASAKTPRSGPRQCHFSPRRIQAPHHARSQSPRFVTTIRREFVGRARPTMRQLQAQFR